MLSRLVDKSFNFNCFCYRNVNEGFKFNTQSQLVPVLATSVKVIQYDYLKFPNLAFNMFYVCVNAQLL